MFLGIEIWYAPVLQCQIMRINSIINNLFNKQKKSYIFETKYLYVEQFYVES